MKDKPDNTESHSASNEEIKRLAGLSNLRRDTDTVKDVKVSLYDVDYNIKWHLENVVKSTITEDNTIITVPILFANGEKWASVQRHGYLRDNQGKLLTPLIMIKRNGVSKREDIQDLKVLETPEARITFERKYSITNRYDRFSATTRKPMRELYSIDVPKFVNVEYDLMCWTNNTTQLNEIVEQMMWFDGKAFGDTYKFITHIDPPQFENMNNVGEDRVVRANMSMRTKAYILNTNSSTAPVIYKLPTITNVVIAEITGSI